MSDASVGAIGNELTDQVLHYALDGLSLQQDVISNNVSNDQTPNFRAKEVDFESSLQQAIQTSPPGTTATTVVYDSPNAPATDGNNVHLAEELVNASKATLQYQAVVHALNFQYNELSSSMGQQAVTP